MADIRILKSMASILCVYLFFAVIQPPVYGAGAPAKKHVRYGCEEYRDRMEVIKPSDALLIPWQSLDHSDWRFYDGVFLSDDDSKVLVAAYKDDFKNKRFEYIAHFFIFDCVTGRYGELGKEKINPDSSLVILEADSKKYVFSRQVRGRPADITVFDIRTMSRTKTTDTEETIYLRSADVSGLAREEGRGDRLNYIASSRLDFPDRFYDGIVTVRGRSLARSEVLRFGSDPLYIRYTPNIIFNFRDRKNSFFGFYNIRNAGKIYFINGDNMIFRHYERGVRVKEYVNLTRLRAVNRQLSKLLFFAEDDFGPRLVVLPLDINALK
jgi:hypothetical protein